LVKTFVIFPSFSKSDFFYKNQVGGGESGLTCPPQTPIPIVFSYHHLKRLISDNTTFQFAVVHYFTKYGSGECYFSSDLSSDSSSDDEDRSQGKGWRRPTDSVRQQSYKPLSFPMSCV
jgi:hypothetical protein